MNEILTYKKRIIIVCEWIMNNNENVSIDRREGMT